MTPAARIVVVLALAACAGCGSRRAASPPPRAQRAPAVQQIESTSPAGALPEHPSRASVVQALALVTPDVDRCVAVGRSVQIAVGIEFASDGSAMRATVHPPRAPDDLDPYDGPRSEVLVDPAARACIERALLRMRLPPFGRPSLVVNYPFRVS